MNTGNWESRIESLEETISQFDLETSLLKCSVNTLWSIYFSCLSHSNCIKGVGKTHCCYTTKCCTQPFGDDLINILSYIFIVCALLYILIENALSQYLWKPHINGSHIRSEESSQSFLTEWFACEWKKICAFLLDAECEDVLSLTNQLIAFERSKHCFNEWSRYEVLCQFLHK